VGAEALGLVISSSVTSEQSTEFSSRVAVGIEDACRSLGVHVLGGDTNISPATSITCCAFGLVPKSKMITRIGCNIGDGVYITGLAGMGNALGLARLSGLPDEYFPETFYKPRARMKEGQIIRQHATCCMDTSDGVLTTLDQLMRLNGKGFAIDCAWDTIIAPHAFDLCKKNSTPPWLMLAGPHGEFELVFTCASDEIEEIKKECTCVDILKVGTVQEKTELSYITSTGSSIIDMTPIRNLLHSVGGDMEQYVKEFMAIGRRLDL